MLSLNKWNMITYGWWTKVKIGMPHAYSIAKHWGACIDNLGQLAHSAEHIKFWLDLCSRLCAYYRTNRTKDESRINQTILHVTTLKVFKCWWLHTLYMSSMPCFLLQNILLEFIINIASWVPGATYPAMKFIFEALQLFSPQNCVGLSDEILVVPNYFPATARQRLLWELMIVRLLWERSIGLSVSWQYLWIM